MRYYFSIASGSKGNCGLYVYGNTAILIDLGVSVRRIGQALKQLDMTFDEIDAVLITHEHTDHIAGLATFAKKYRIPIYATAPTAEELTRRCPQASENIRCISGGESFPIGECIAEPFFTPHDAAESVGYLLHNGEDTFGFATDLGFMPGEVQKKLSGCDAVVLESNHDPALLQAGPYPYPLKVRISGPRGHLSNLDCSICAEKLAQNGTNTIILAHLSEQNNTPELALRETTDAVRAFDCRVLVAPKDAMEEPIYFMQKGVQKQCSLFE